MTDRNVWSNVRWRWLMERTDQYVWKSVDTPFLHIRAMESLNTWQLESQYPSHTRQLESQCTSYLAPGEPVCLIHPAAGEPVSLISGSWRASIPHIASSWRASISLISGSWRASIPHFRQLESLYPSYPAAGKLISFIYQTQQQYKGYNVWDFRLFVLRTGVPVIWKVHFLRFPMFVLQIRVSQFMKVHVLRFPTFCSAHRSPRISESTFF